MIADTRLQTLLQRLNVPTQDLAQLSFCAGSKEQQVSAWVNALPVTRVNHVSTLLYQAVPEISRLKTNVETRLAILESLRPAVQQCIQGLSQHFLNQPLILPETARKTATIAQALQKHMTNGYLVAVIELCRTSKSSSDDSKSQRALAIHRALTGLGLLLLRSYQLYTPIAGQLWTELNTLYQVADGLELTEHPVKDPLAHHQQVQCIRQAYLRPILLACARPNQMRQDEVLATYNGLESLIDLAKLLPYFRQQKDNLFAVVLNSNRPPLYKTRLPDNRGDEVLELNTSQLAVTLAEQIKQTAGNADSGQLRNAYDLSPALTDHLVQAWNILAQRSFDRQQVSGDIEVTVGLTNLHFHICDQQSFTLFLNQTANISGATAEKMFQKRGIQLKNSQAEDEQDPWGSAFDIAGTSLAGKALPTLSIESSIRQQEMDEYQGKHPVYSVPLVDVSPGGYCLEWQEEIPNQVKAGELVGMREKGRQKWSLGVVRWVQQSQGATQLGVQVLAPHAIPLGVAIVHKTGGYSEYLRALQLPALKAINQAATLLTNAVSFREYSKVRLFRPVDHSVNPLELPEHPKPHETTVQLTRRVFSTGAFSQFTYREVTGTKTESSENKDDFDSVWQKK